VKKFVSKAVDEKVDGLDV